MNHPEAPKRRIVAIDWSEGAPRARLECGHLANILARSRAALERRIGTTRRCYACAESVRP